VEPCGCLCDCCAPDARWRRCECNSQTGRCERRAAHVDTLGQTLCYFCAEPDEVCPCPCAACREPIAPARVRCRCHEGERQCDNWATRLGQAVPLCDQCYRPGWQFIHPFYGRCGCLCEACYPGESTEPRRQDRQGHEWRHDGSDHFCTPLCQTTGVVCTFDKNPPTLIPDGAAAGGPCYRAVPRDG